MSFVPTIKQQRDCGLRGRGTISPQDVEAEEDSTKQAEGLHESHRYAEIQAT